MPECSKLCYPLPLDLGDLPRNFITESCLKIQQLYHSDVVGSLCEWCTDVEDGRPDVDKAALYFCLDCEQRTCRTCCDMHYRQRECATHNIIDINDPELDRLIAAQPKFCQKHTHKRCCFYCYGCRLTICLECYFEEHLRHTCRELKKVSSSLVDAIKRHCSAVKKEEHQLSMNIREQQNQNLLTEATIDKLCTDAMITKISTFLQEVTEEEVRNRVKVYYNELLQSEKENSITMSSRKLYLLSVIGKAETLLQRINSLEFCRNAEELMDSWTPDDNSLDIIWSPPPSARSWTLAGLAFGLAADKMKQLKTTALISTTQAKKTYEFQSDVATVAVLGEHVFVLVKGLMDDDVIAIQTSLNDTDAHVTLAIDYGVSKYHVALVDLTTSDIDSALFLAEVGRKYGSSAFVHRIQIESEVNYRRLSTYKWKLNYIPSRITVSGGGRLLVTFVNTWKLNEYNMFGLLLREIQFPNCSTKPIYVLSLSDDLLAVNYNRDAVCDSGGRSSIVDSEGEPVVDGITGIMKGAYAHTTDKPTVGRTVTTVLVINGNRKPVSHKNLPPLSCQRATSQMSPSAGMRRTCTLYATTNCICTDCIADSFASFCCSNYC